MPQFTRTKKKFEIARIASDLLRVGMWPISKPVSKTTDPINGIVKRIYRYDKGKNSGVIVVHGELCESDRGAFLIIRTLDKQNNFEGVHGWIPDLIKLKGVKNIHNPSAINPMWDSIENLLDVHVRIRPNRRGGSLSAGFKLVTCWIDSSGEFFLTTGDYQKVIESLGLYEVKIPLQEYFKSRSQITRSLKWYLKYQNPVYSEKGYEISLEKLCKYIGYDIEGRPWSYVWQNVERAVNELKKEKFLQHKSNRDETRNKTEGGIVTFWAVKKQIKETGISNHLL